MCGYSLEGRATRPAAVGETLVSRAVGDCQSVGLVSPQNLDLLVCVPFGARVRLTGDIKESIRRDYQLTEPVIEGVFAQRPMPDGKPGGYRDGIRFDGYEHIVLLQDLLGDMEVTVLSLPGEGAGAVPSSAAAQKREPELA